MQSLTITAASKSESSSAGQRKFPNPGKLYPKIDTYENEPAPHRSRRSRLRRRRLAEGELRASENSEARRFASRVSKNNTPCEKQSGPAKCEREYQYSFACEL